jgi:hypothetical protein
LADFVAEVGDDDKQRGGGEDEAVDAVICHCSTGSG